MNIVDLIILVLLVLAAYRGWRRGLVKQIFELGLGFAGLLLGVAFGPRIASAFTDSVGVEVALLSLLFVFAAVTLGQTIGFIVGHRFGSIARRANLGALDSGLGVALGITVTLVSFWLVGSLLVQGPSREVARALRKSRSLTLVNAVFPKPPDVLAYLRQYLDTAGFPQVFAGLPRPIGPPVELPSDALVRRAVEAAEASVVRINVPACGGIQLGTGWVADEDTVVTNAHVVAGGDDVNVEDSGGTHDAAVVVFDPETDVAVLHVEGLAGPALDLVREELERGRPGATLGYPGGGDLVWRKAAVQAHYTAVGRDIYGRSLASRDIYELRAPVRRGDSGGPFVLPSGAVGGVVFAASTTDGDTGYALTADEVEDDIARGSGRTRPVGTGGCTR